MSDNVMGCGFCGEDWEDDVKHWLIEERGKSWCKNRPLDRNGSCLTKKDLTKI